MGSNDSLSPLCCRGLLEFNNDNVTPEPVNKPTKPPAKAERTPPSVEEALVHIRCEIDEVEATFRASHEGRNPDLSRFGDLVDLFHQIDLGDLQENSGSKGRHMDFLHELNRRYVLRHATLAEYKQPLLEDLVDGLLARIVQNAPAREARYQLEKLRCCEGILGEDGLATAARRVLDVMIPVLEVTNEHNTPREWQSDEPYDSTKTKREACEAIRGEMASQCHAAGTAIDPVVRLGSFKVDNSLRQMYKILDRAANREEKGPGRFV